MYVEEKDRSWCSSNGANDHRAITIEVANDGGADTGWHVSDKAMVALIDLCVDICKRNGIKKLLWKADKSLIGQVDKQNMTVHRWFAAKSCPGDYLFGKHAEIAEKVNARLGSTTTASKKPPSVAKLEPAKDYDKKFARTFTVLTDSLNMRYGAGVDKKILTALKKGASFRCYGYFTETKDGTIWLFGVSGGKMGFCSKKYLK